jgi:hypothetical protein
MVTDAEILKITHKHKNLKSAALLLRTGLVQEDATLQTMTE